MSAPLTLTIQGDEDLRDSSARRRPFLFLVLPAAKPFSPGVRVCLDRVQVVAINRGERRIEASDDERARVSIWLPDSCMSSKHASATRRGDEFVLIDHGSKNGTFANGERVENHRISDGDAIQIGTTFWLYREVACGEPAIEVLDDASTSAPHPGLATLSPELEDAYSKLERVSSASVPVLLLGETGTGKEVAARAIHELSGRTGRFVAVNCAALTDTLFHSQLFGHRRGAFSGATEDRRGLIRDADGGTLFLDEIAELAEPSQAALLRVLQEREVMAVGGTTAAPVDIRLITATHQDLSQRIGTGAFREDLYARLAGFKLRLPRLRDRREDLGLLIASLLRDPAIARHEQRQFSQDAARLLMAYPWPHNIRELQQVLTSAAALSDRTIEVAHLPDELVEEYRSGHASSASLAEPSHGLPLSEVEKKYILSVLDQVGWNKSKAARVLGISRPTLDRKIRDYDLRPTSPSRR